MNFIRKFTKLQLFSVYYTTVASGTGVYLTVNKNAIVKKYNHCPLVNEDIAILSLTAPFTMPFVCVLALAYYADTLKFKD